MIADCQRGEVQEGGDGDERESPAAIGREDGSKILFRSRAPLDTSQKRNIHSVLEEKKGGRPSKAWPERPIHERGARAFRASK